MTQTRNIPQAPDTEKALLGAMMLDKVACEHSLSLVWEQCFYLENHKVLFRAMQKLHAKGVGVDQVTVFEEVKSMGELENIGGVVTISDVANRVPTSSSYEDYANIVKDKYIKRFIIESSQSLISEAYEDKDGILDTADTMQANLSRLHESGGNIFSMEDMFVKLSQPRSRPVPTGFLNFDGHYGGLWKKTLTVIGGRPSMGKTALAMSFLLSIARSGVPVVFFSMEMGVENVGLRLLSMESGVDHEAIRGKELTPEEQECVDTAQQNLMTYPITVMDRSGMNIYEIKAITRKLHMEGRCEVAFADYLQLMNKVGDGETNSIKTGLISREAKALARELEIPLVLLAQLSRRCEERPDKRPMMSDLRDSGEIEQDADMILYPFRPFVYSHDISQENDAELIIAKNRNGRTGMLKNYRWSGSTVTYYETRIFDY